MFGQPLNNQQTQIKDDTLSDINVQNQQQQPTDSVSCIDWKPDFQQKIFAAGCWDGKVKVFNVQQHGLMQQLEVNMNDTVQSLAWKNDGTMIFVAAGNSLKVINTANQQVMEMGQHKAGISNVFWSENHQMVVTTGFDCCINLWSMQQQNGQPALSIPLDRKVYCAALKEEFLAMGLQGEKILIETLSNLKTGKINPANMFDSGHLGSGSQINSISINKKDGKPLFGVASVDGRANMSGFEPNNTQQGGWNCNSIMTFKCHKEEKNNQQIMHPVNAIGFNPKSENFVFTAGSEGKMYFWDILAKNKIRTFQFPNAPITAASMSPDGQCIAYALGYDWHAGYEKFNQFKNFKICVHLIPDNELRHQK